MSIKTGISWCDHTWSPWIGCEKVSPGCMHCYVETMVNGRMNRPETWGKRGTRPKTKSWPQVRSWNRAALRAGERRRVFPSLCDVFENRDDDQRAILAEMWDLVAECPGLDFLLLTKRPDHIRQLLPREWGNGWPNVWLGVSVESGEKFCICGHSRRPVSERVEVLAGVPAVVRFVSYEPAIGPPGGIFSAVFDWLIYGAESGQDRRPEGTPEDPKLWAEEVRDTCKKLGIAYWHKQSSGFRSGQGVELKGELIHELPTPRQGPPPRVTGQGRLF